jgi:hypothetical protein
MLLLSHSHPDAPLCPLRHSRRKPDPKLVLPAGRRRKWCGRLGNRNTDLDVRVKHVGWFRQRHGGGRTIKRMHQCNAHAELQ